MELQLFLNPETTILGLFTGIIFGFLLRKGTVSRFDTIVGQLLLRDFTVLKVMFTAIVVGSIGIFFLNDQGIIPALNVSKTAVLYVFIGAIIFGVGMSVAGYCPGTAVAAIAEGSEDMIFGLLGMLLASFVFNYFSPTLMPIIKQVDITHQETLSSFWGISYWVVIACLVVIWAVFALAIRKYEQKAFK